MGRASESNPAFTRATTRILRFQDLCNRCRRLRTLVRHHLTVDRSLRQRLPKAVRQTGNDLLGTGAYNAGLSVPPCPLPEPA
ncbi:hypothetical protein C4K04_6182 [Pseudomonas chlororaphis]|uniref:Uncharacterized protein n=1 Tax=Pseudomonas chlororaphis TaxID=587753 RepID=A0A3G7TXS5_9PSED|nr:hypothetical protein C4K04_6182 [Pseudomonas chlororaphis]